MHKLGFTGMKSMDHFRSLSGSLAGAGKAAYPPSNPRSSSDSISYGSFANLKLTAEKLVKEQASVKTDLEMTHTKLKRATELIHVLESKLQQAVNENAKLKVKQTEDSKLWQGLDSKLSSTKTMCDQLTETLQQLAGQTLKAEEDKKSFEGRLEHHLKSFNDFDSLLNDSSTRLKCAEKEINDGKQLMVELKHEKEELERSFNDQLFATDTVIKEKDSVIKELELTVEENKAHLQTLDSQLKEMEQGLRTKEDICISLRACVNDLESEKCALQHSNQDFAHKIDELSKEHKELETLLLSLMAKIIELDKENANVSGHVSKLLCSFGTYYELIQEEKDLTVKSARKKFEFLYKEYIHSISMNDAFRMEIVELKTKIMELQKAQEFVMVQHAEECRLAEDKIRGLESEAEDILSKKDASDKLASDLQEEIRKLCEASSLTEKQMQDMLQKISKLESEKQDLLDKVQLVLQEQAQETEALQSEITKRNQQVDALENHVSQLQGVLDEKEHLHKSIGEREKQLEEQNLQIQVSLTAAESRLTEAKKQYDLMLEGKQLELSRHLKELSQRNDQAEILRKELERKCDEKLSENKEDAQQHLMSVKEEHGAMINKIQQDHNEKESSLRVHHKEELQHLQLQVENEMRERMSSLRKEHEIQISSLKLQHEDEYRKLQEELELQKSKEEKQRALLQLQWKVMGENQQVDQEVNSKKEYSVSSIKMRDSYGRKQHQFALTSPQSRRKDVTLSGMMRTPIANILKKVEKGSDRNIPKHSKVTRHEYEVETTNGRTITKRRKTRSTVMFGESNSLKAKHSRSPDDRKDVTTVRKVLGGTHSHPANIGDLFSEGSLNPYNDDPYAFD
ncbi:synaptonemal complex protein ZEP1-like isoform X2 [Typha latifolia]|uniref:synaptonemal complex protein ZEP1-like isoform X2 n=1 Tax=Typha latifolia TaxID=4733 RepID=UPI003C2B2FDB